MTSSSPPSPPSPPPSCRPGLPWADRLRLLRSALGWSRLRLAQRLGVSPATINALERGATTAPSTPVILRLRRIESAYAEELTRIADAERREP
jgi:transcriptional regulator with XRE-family HTH domain